MSLRLLFLVLPVLLTGTASAADPLPNVILILADDK